MFVLSISGVAHGVFEKTSDVSLYLATRLPNLVHDWAPGATLPAGFLVQEFSLNVGLSDMSRGRAAYRTAHKLAEGEGPWDRDATLRSLIQAKGLLAREATEHACYAAVRLAEGQE